MISGSELLATIEKLLDESRGEVLAVDRALERSSLDLERLREAELGALGVLARVRLREIESGELVDAFDATARQVASVLAERDEARAGIEATIVEAERALAESRAERDAQAAVVDRAEASLDDAEAEAQRRLADDPGFESLVERARASDTVADLAEAKAAAAHEDRKDKGRPYEADALFAYLWQRGFGTPKYRAGALARLVDRWVARVANFEALRRDYWILSELPARMDEHAARMRAVADDDVAAMQARETAAAEAAGMPARERALDEAEAALAELDRRVEGREADLAALVERRARFAAGDDDHSRRALDLLRETYRSEQMRALRDRANRTPTRDDDRAVDELTAIRVDTMRLEDEVRRYRSLHDGGRGRVAKLEDIRGRFKERRYDAGSSEFVNEALISTLLTQLLSGTLSVGDIWDALEKQQRFRRRHADPRFGSGGFPRAPNPWRMPGKFPKGRWPGGGGFGGGGFGRGGGFGGGGFKTGGGF